MLNVRKYSLSLASLTSLLQDKIGFNRRKVLIFAVISLAMILRIYGLGEHSIWKDEAGTSSLVKTLIEGGSPEYPSGEESYRSLPYMISTAFVVNLLGFSDFSLRLSALIYALITIILVFKFSSEYFDFETGILSALILATSSWHIAMSQNARMYTMFQLIYFTVFYFLFKYKKSGKNSQLAIIIISAVLAMLTHATGYILVLTIPFYLVWKKDSIKDQIIPISVIILLMIVVAELFYWDFFWLVYGLEISYQSATDHLIWILKNIPHLTLLGVLGFITKKSIDKGYSQLAAVALLPPFTVYLFFVDLSASRYIFYSLPFLAIATSLGIFEIKQKIFPKVKDRETILLIIIIFTMINNPLNPELGSNSPQRDYKTVYDHISEDKESDDIVISGRPLVAEHYLLDKPDYSLIEKGAEQDLINDGKEYYTGQPVINNSREFKQLKRQNRTLWISVTENIQKGIDKEIIKEIENTTLILNKSKINLWKWENSDGGNK